jgi:hypothetical protein
MIRCGFKGDVIGMLSLTSLPHTPEDYSAYVTQLVIYKKYQ